MSEYVHATIHRIIRLASPFGVVASSIAGDTTLRLDAQE